MASEAFQIGADFAQISKERLTEAGLIDEAARAYLFPAVLNRSGLQFPEVGKILFTGVIFKEGHVNSKFESRLFTLRIEKDWTPMMTYAKAEAPQEILAEHHLKSFTFVPTKLVRKEFTMSWRLDATGVSIGKSKHDKLVLGFRNAEECHLWQAAMSLAKTPEKHAENLKRSLEEERARVEAAKQEEEQRVEREQEEQRSAAIELAIAQSITKVTAEEQLLEAKALAARAAEEEEAARLVMEKEQREEEEARERMQKEQAEADAAQRKLEQEAAEAEAAHRDMEKEEWEAEQARIVMEKERKEAEDAREKFDKEHAEFIAAVAEHAKEFEEAEVAFQHLEAVRSKLLDALQRGNKKEIEELEELVAAAEQAWVKEAEEAKEALERMKKEQREAEEAKAAHEKEQAEADAAAREHDKEEAEAAAARAVYQKEEAERMEALQAYEKEKAEADFARTEYEREAAEAAAARSAHDDKQKEANEARAMQLQREKEAANAAAEEDRLKTQVENLKKSAAATPKAAPKPAVDHEKARAALEFVTAGAPLHKYMRAKLINAKWHEPRSKAVRMNGTQIQWDKRSYRVANAKMGGSLMLKANSPSGDFSTHFHCMLSGVAGGLDQLDFRAPSSDAAELWVLGILASIDKLPS
jgi:hypothetical protein